MPPKRAYDDDPPLMNKIQRIEHGLPISPVHPHPNNDFSGSVKRKLADSKRTGQACDRCKVRKIRCDGRPEGCTPCEQNRTPCRTTDRITGRATTRGQIEAMEAENQHLRSQIADLQAQLKENGIEPRVAPAFNGLQAQSTTLTLQRRTSSPLEHHVPSSDTEKTEYRTLPQFKHGAIGDNYLGVGASDSRLSHIRGTSLSIFGTDIDILDYMVSDSEYENSVMSYSSLSRMCLGVDPVDPAPLPSYKQLKDYAMWFLRSLNPYTMLVHKPAFMDLIHKLGTDPSFQPTIPEVVNVHMMLATIQYQIATRNQQSALLEESHKHYRYAMSFYKDLTNGVHTLEDVQALAMICHHLRNFPKPGAAWIMTSITYLFALELGLHRSVKNWKEGHGHLSKLDIEKRKRVFWAVHALQVNLNGKLGRPMPISNEDIDVEFPEAMNDCLPGEEAHLDENHRCSFKVGIQIAKYTVWEVDLYKMMYSVKSSPNAYLEQLRHLEAGIQKWKDELPYELRDPSQAAPDDLIFTLYLEYWYQSYHLQLYHPAVCRSTDPTVVSTNLDRCLEASQKMLHNCNQMMLKKSLDIPWINTVVYIAAIFTNLYISSIRQTQLSPADFTNLKSDMATWVTVLGECDHFLASGDKLKNAIAKIIDQSLQNINSNIVKRTATESLARVALHTPQQSSAPPIYDSGAYREQYTAPAAVPTDPALGQQTQNYNNLTATTAHTYNMGNSMPIPQQTSAIYDHQPSYSTGEDTGMTQTHAAALVAATGNPPQSSDTYAYGQVPNGGHTTYTSNNFAPQDWRQWTRAYIEPQSQALGQPGEYLNTATTLMALGGRDGGTHNPGNDGQGSIDSSAVQGHGGHAHWPEIVFPAATNGHMAQQ